MNLMEHRTAYYRYFQGVGIDVGPFDKPFFDDPALYGISVKYVDRYTGDELKRLFPEIQNLHPTPSDYICDVSKDGFSFAQDETFDFIILSHLLEHVANPFFVIKDAYRVLKENGVLYISIPDCRFSDDIGRPKTTFNELDNLFKNDMRDISNHYVEEYLKSQVISSIPWVKEVLKDPTAIQQSILDNEKKRSFHVHVWDRGTFFQHISYFLEKYKFNAALLDLSVYENNSYENSIVLRKTKTYESEKLGLHIRNLYLVRSGEPLLPLDTLREGQREESVTIPVEGIRSEAKVAVITRTKNRTILLRRAIESVLSQVFQDWIMVIVNDGGDNADVERLVEEYKDKFRDRYFIIHNETSLGMEAASNIGIKSSASEYVVIHDDDDSWHPAFLGKCIQFLDNNQHPTIRGVVTYSKRILERIQNGKILTESEESFNTWLESVSLYRMAANNTFPPISFVYERKILNEIGLYREDLPVLGDWEFNLRFLSKYDIFLIREELSYYHHRLSIKNGDYSNSVVGNDDKHIYYDTLIRNDLIRKDLGNNAIGMGYLVNIGKSFETLHGQISNVENFIRRITGIKWLRKIAKKFM
jgi:glycosyltransferase involved in cell wall biosynthesis/predicted SAM-dependent methyltransferase